MKKRFQQTDFWCDFKCAHGWKKLTKNNINILYRTFKKGFIQFSLAYVPMAFEINDDEFFFDEKQNPDFEANYLQTLNDFAYSLKNDLPSNTLCIRYDLPLNFQSIENRNSFLYKVKNLSKVLNLNIKKSKIDIQPPDSTFLDLTKTDEDLLLNMKNKWRYNIRYAQKHDVKVRSVTASSTDFERDLESFYSLYKITALRDGIGLHPKSYYKDLLERGNDGDTKITLYLARHEDEDLAAIITLFNADEAIYLYGCSSNQKRNLMPAYLVQWTAICDAQKFGSKIYDFYGIPPTPDENHPMHGLYLFKTGFGGQMVHRLGCFDVPLSPFYRLYSIAEELRAFWHKKILKKIRGR